jgi:hypothetical protein
MPPTFHLNGTSRDVLDQQYENALAKLQDAIKALEDASPNGRDYYLQGPNAFGIAQASHFNLILRRVPLLF